MTLWRVRATVDDRPGFLSVLTASLALRSVNIISVQVHGTEAGAVDDFLCDAPDDLSEAELIAAIVRGRGRDPWVRRTDAQHLVDPPTDVLSAAARLVRTPWDLPDVLAGVLLNASVRHVELPATRGGGLTTNRMQIPGPDGGTLLVERDAPPFTPAEYARACALVDVAAEVRATSGVHWFVALPDGVSVELRPGASSDADALAALYARCSDETLRRRYPAGRPPRAQASRSCDVIAVEPAGDLVGVGSLRLDGNEAEVALLVEDAWQRRGIGTAILRRLIEIAEDAPTGVLAVHAHSHTANEAMIRTMGRLELPLRRARDGHVTTVTADLRPAREGADSVVGVLPRPVNLEVGYRTATSK